MTTRSSNTYLHLNIQHYDFSLPRLLLNRHLARPVPIAPKLGVLDEAISGNEVLEGLRGDKMVVYAILLAGSGTASRVRYGETERVGVVVEEAFVESSFADP